MEGLADSTISIVTRGVQHFLYGLSDFELNKLLKLLIFLALISLSPPYCCLFLELELDFERELELDFERELELDPGIVVLELDLEADLNFVNSS
jgi:hypothetical protein